MKLTSQTYIGSEKNYGSEDILCPQKILGLKAFGSKEFMGQRNFWAQIDFGSKQIFRKKSCFWKTNLRKIRVQKNFGSEFFFGSNKF